MLQQPLFNTELDEQLHDTCGVAYLGYSETELLERFREQRISEGAHPRSVARELSQLRSIVRESHQLGGPTDLASVFADLTIVARVLSEPSVPISAATGRARLIAAQRFIRINAVVGSYDANEQLTELDALLPASQRGDWHQAGTLVAGSRSRQRKRGPTFDAQDLHRVLHAASQGNGHNRIRDRALVALHCFSGLRPEEIVTICWGDVEVEQEVDEHYALRIRVDRQGRSLRLPLPRQAASALVDLASDTGGTIRMMAGPVFKSRNSSSVPLTYRTARDVLTRACRSAGLPAVEAVELRTAFAHWLGTLGMSDHEIASILGLQRVRSVDRLLARHRALDAQRQVRATIDS